MKAMTVLAEGTLFVVAVVLLVYPEARTTPLHVLLVALYVGVTLPDLWRMWRSGVLTMTPSQMVATAGTRARSTLLSTLSVLVGTVAVIVLT